MQEKRFQKRVEDFVCENCGTHVAGTGFTNHCPKCLWSKHVDDNPGDRHAECGGMMKPVGIEVRGDTYTIIHRCVMCTHQRKNKVVPEDDFEKVIELSGKAGGGDA